MTHFALRPLAICTQAKDNLCLMGLTFWHWDMTLLYTKVIFQIYSKLQNNAKKTSRDDFLKVDFCVGLHFLANLEYMQSLCYRVDDTSESEQFLLFFLSFLSLIILCSSCITQFPNGKNSKVSYCVSSQFLFTILKLELILNLGSKWAHIIHF